MKTLKFIIIPNPFKDQEYARYDCLGQFVTNGTHTLADVAAALVDKRLNVTESFITFTAGLLFEVIAEEVADDYRCSIDGLAFATAISGTFPAANSPFSDENELYVSVTVGDPLRTEVAALEPVKDTEESVAVAIRRVEDVATHEIGVIHGTSTVSVTGRNMSATLTGESISLADPDTLEVKSIGTVVAQDGLGQRLDVNFAPPFEAGKYLLVLVSRGYATPDAEPQTYSKAVTALEGVSPKKAITLTNMVCSLAANKITATLTNGEGTLDANPTAGTVLGDLYKNGVIVTTAKEMSWNPTTKAFECEIGAAEYAVGDTAKVILHPDPAKESEYEQNEIIAECVVTA